MSERLLNTGAETGSEPWVLEGYANLVQVPTPHSGAWSFRLRKIVTDGLVELGSMEQTVILSPGIRHDVSTWVKSDLIGAGLNFLRCEVDKGDGVLVTLDQTSFGPLTWWHWNVGSFVAVGGIGRVRFSSGGPASTADGRWLLDDLSLWAPFASMAMASRFQVVQALREAFVQVSLANGYNTAVTAVRFQTPRHADGQLAPPTGPIIVLPAYREDEGPGTTSDQGLTDERWTQAVVIIVPRPRSSDPFDLLFLQWLCNAYDDMLRVCLGIESTKLGRLVQEITTSKVVWDADTPKPWGSIYFYLQIHEMRDRNQLGVA